MRKPKAIYVVVHDVGSIGMACTTRKECIEVLEHFYGTQDWKQRHRIIKYVPAKKAKK